MAAWRRRERMSSSSPSLGLGLLDEALGFGVDAGATRPWRVALVLDCVETSGAFVLHHLLKRSLSAADGDRGAVVFLALAQPFSHYDRVLRKMGCNLSVQRNKNRLHFFDLLNLEISVKDESFSESIETGLLGLYNKILRAIEASSPTEQSGHITIIIDDLSLLEIAAHGSIESVFNFLHYCTTLTSEVDCSLVILNHEDIYMSEESLLLSHLDYLSDVVIKIESLSTGIAADVHGQLSVVSKGSFTKHGQSTNKARNFQFKVKENGVEYFYAGSKH